MGPRPDEAYDKESRDEQPHADPRKLNVVTPAVVADDAEFAASTVCVGFFIARTLVAKAANDADQRLATKRLSTPPDFIASPLHRFVPQVAP